MATADASPPGDAARPVLRGEEKDEKALTREIAKIIHDFIQRRFNEGRRPARRDAHAKDSGCVKAIFRVNPDVPKELRHGVLETPGREFKAWIRFFKGNSEVRSSRWPDAHGMAVKLFGVDGEKLLPDEKSTQDFVMCNQPVFFVDRIDTYRDTLEVFHSGGLPGQVRSVFKLRTWREKFLAIKTNFFSVISNPLFSQYWSATPYRLGPHEIKFTAKPRLRAEGFFGRLWRRADATFAYVRPGFSLKQRMAETLAVHEMWFDFYVQLGTGDERTPIEDPTVEWKESVTEPKPVAKIIIPCQDLSSPDRDCFCEDLSFNPWHGLAAHEPLGATNRVRREVYPAISKLRHELNLRPPHEPTGDEPF